MNSKQAIKKYGLELPGPAHKQTSNINPRSLLRDRLGKKQQKHADRSAAVVTTGSGSSIPDKHRLVSALSGTSIRPRNPTAASKHFAISSQLNDWRESKRSSVYRSTYHNR